MFRSGRATPHPPPPPLATRQGSGVSAPSGLGRAPSRAHSPSRACSSVWSPFSLALPRREGNWASLHLPTGHLLLSSVGCPLQSFSPEVPRVRLQAPHPSASRTPPGPPLRPATPAPAPRPRESPASPGRLLGLLT